MTEQLTSTRTGTCTLLSINPNNGPVYGGTLVTITGALLQHVVVVTFGGAPARSLKIENAGEVTCITPPGAPGTCEVYAYDDMGNKSNPLTFTYNES